MQNDIKQKIQNRIDNAEKLNKGLTFDWFKRFFEMLESAGVSNEIIIKTMDYTLCADGLERITAKGNCEGSFRNTQTKVVIEIFLNI